MKADVLCSENYSLTQCVKEEEKDLVHVAHFGEYPFSRTPTIITYTVSHGDTAKPILKGDRAVQHFGSGDLYM